MNKLMKLMVLWLVALFVIGCGKGPIEEDSSSQEELVTIEFWDLANEGDVQVNEAALKAIADIETEYPNIKVNYTPTDGNEYKTKIKAAVAADKNPDIFYTWLPGFSQEFVDDGKVLKLDDYLSEETYNNIDVNILESGNASYDGIYALSTDIKMGVLYCNKALFDKHNISIPETYDELIGVVNQFDEVGINALLVPGKRFWPVMWLYDIMAIKSIGVEESIKVLNKKSSFGQNAFLEVANKIKELSDSNAFIEGSAGLDNIEANQMFLDGESPMYFAGSWFAINIANSEQEIKEHVIVKNFPGFDNEFDKHMLGGNGVGYMVSNNSEHKEEAVIVLEMFTKLMAENDFVLFSAWNVEKDFSKMDPIFTQLNTIYNEADGFVIWWDTYMNSTDAQKHKTLTLQLFVGVISPEEFIEGMKEISDK